jgi:hypothetical protein
MMHLRGTSCFQTGSDHDLQRLLATPPWNVERSNPALPGTSPPTDCRLLVRVEVSLCHGIDPRTDPIVYPCWIAGFVGVQHRMPWHCPVGAARWESMFGLCALVPAGACAICPQHPAVSAAATLLHAPGGWSLSLPPTFEKLEVHAHSRLDGGLCFSMFQHVSYTGAWWRFKLSECLQSSTSGWLCLAAGTSSIRHSC